MLGYFYCISYLPESQLLQNHYAYHVILLIGGSLLQLPDLNRNLCVLSFFSTLDYPEREIRKPQFLSTTQLLLPIEHTIPLVLSKAVHSLLPISFNVFSFTFPHFSLDTEKRYSHVPVWTHLHRAFVPERR